MTTKVNKNCVFCKLYSSESNTLPLDGRYTLGPVCNGCFKRVTTYQDGTESTPNDILLMTKVMLGYVHKKGHLKPPHYKRAQLVDIAKLVSTWQKTRKPNEFADSLKRAMKLLT